MSKRMGTITAFAFLLMAWPPAADAADRTTSRPTAGPSARPAWVPRYAGPWDASVLCLQLGERERPGVVSRRPISYAASAAGCELKDGRLLAVFQYYSRERRDDFDCLAQAASIDGGETWSAPQRIDVRGLPADDAAPRDPALVATPDGMRLYFTRSPRRGTQRIATAFSKDGLKFDWESDGGLSLSEGGAFDPTVIRVNDGVHLFARRVGKQDALLHARARDGRHFDRLADIPLVRGSTSTVSAPYRVVLFAGRDPITLASGNGTDWYVVADRSLRGLAGAATLQRNNGTPLLLCTIDSAVRGRKIARGGRTAIRTDGRDSPSSGGSSASDANAPGAAGIASAPGASAAPGATGDGSSPADGAAGEDASLAQSSADSSTAQAQTLAGEQPDAQGADPSQAGATASGATASPSRRRGADGRSVEGGDPANSEAGLDLGTLVEGDIPASDAEVAAPESGAAPGASDWPPLATVLPPDPDFKTPNFYVDWIRGRQGQVADNAAPLYSDLLVRNAAEGGYESKVPPLDNIFTDDSGGTPGPWNPAEHPNYEASRQTAEPFVTGYAEAASHADYVTMLRFDHMQEPDPPLIGFLLPDLSSHRALARQMISDGWRAPNGQVDPDAMVRSWNTVLGGAKHLDSGFTLIEQLVGTAEQGLVSENARQALAQDVFKTPQQLENALATLQSKTPPMRDPAKQVAGELAFCLDSVQHCASIGPDGQPHYDIEKVRKFSAFFGETGKPVPDEELQPVLKRDPRESVRVFREHFSQMAEMMRHGYPEANMKALDELAEKPVRSGLLESQLLPSLSRAHAIQTRGVAGMRATQLAYAVHLYRARNGHWPESLDDLPPEHTAGARTDPFSQKDFVYRVTENGPTIYSVSENSHDDGGTHAARWGDDTATESMSDDFVFWPPQPRKVR